MDKPEPRCVNLATPAFNQKVGRLSKRTSKFSKKKLLSQTEETLTHVEGQQTEACDFQHTSSVPKAVTPTDICKSTVVMTGVKSTDEMLVDKPTAGTPNTGAADGIPSAAPAEVALTGAGPSQRFSESDMAHDVHDMAELAKMMSDLPPEDDSGFHEYKRQLIDPSPERFQELISQLKYRITEGQGEALYEIGVEDDGRVRGLPVSELAASLATLSRMAAELGAVAVTVLERPGSQGQAITVLVRMVPQDSQHVEIRIATVGNVDSGKSTLLGVLTRGQLDNGRGAARTAVFRHKHEAESGRTSSISQQVLGFSPVGEVLNYGGGGKDDVHHRTWGEIVSKASKVLAFIDLAGHERYLKTTLFGLTGHLPDYTLVAVDSNRGGVVGMTREHLGIALALNLPVFIVINKIDLCSPHILEKTLASVFSLLKRPGVRKLPVVMRSCEDVLGCLQSLAGRGVVVPIFLVSCVTGASLDLFRFFLNHLPVHADWAEALLQPARMHIDDSYTVTGVGTVVTGTVMGGCVAAGQTLLLGPDQAGHWREVQVRSLRNKRVGVKTVAAGQTAAAALRGKQGQALKKRDVVKGMALLDKSLNPSATWFFSADVVVLVHPTTLRVGYTPVVHALTVRQAARIHAISQYDVLRTGDRARVTFQFLYRPEFLVIGSRIVFREGRTKGIGTIVELQPLLKPQDRLRDVGVNKTASGR